LLLNKKNKVNLLKHQIKFEKISFLLLPILQNGPDLAIVHKFECFIHLIYRTRAITTRGLYISNPLFEGQKRFFKEVFSENSAFTYG
jgi:hypothetical protein